MIMNISIDILSPPLHPFFNTNQIIHLPINTHTYNFSIVNNKPMNLQKCW